MLIYLKNGKRSFSINHFSFFIREKKLVLFFLANSANPWRLGGFSLMANEKWKNDIWKMFYLSSNS